jgi:hypothetical protein
LPNTPDVDSPRNARPAREVCLTRHSPAAPNGLTAVRRAC